MEPKKTDKEKSTIGSTKGLQTIAATDKLQKFIDGFERITQDNAEKVLSSILVFLQQGANPNIIHKNGITLLQFVIEVFKVKDFPLKYQEEIMRVMINSGADINAVSMGKERESVLMSAIYAMLPNIVRLLLNYGADLSYKNSFGITAKEIAEVDDQIKKIVDEYSKKSKIP